MRLHSVFIIIYNTCILLFYCVIIGEDLYRANSMRVLAKIIDAAMLGAIERYLKQAIVDRNAFVASSALMAGLRLFVTCPEIVRRWINEVQEAGKKNELRII